MKTVVDENTKSGSLVLRDELTIASALVIRDALVKSLAEVSSLTMDVSSASAVDLSFLQLLCSAHRTATREGKSVALAGRSSGALQKVLVETGYRRVEGCILDVNKNCLWVEKYHE